MAYVVELSVPTTTGPSPRTGNGNTEKRRYVTTRGAPFRPRQGEKRIDIRIVYTIPNALPPLLLRPGEVLVTTTVTCSPRSTMTRKVEDKVFCGRRDNGPNKHTNPTNSTTPSHQSRRTFKERVVPEITSRLRWRRLFGRH